MNKTSNLFIASDKALSRQIVATCKSQEVKHIVISPGSRNAPLTIGFTSDPYFSCYSIVDERCAAFFALGIAQQLREPTVVVCTSGSALLNYFPAVSEAYYSDIPLLVISADRPANLIDIGDGQTIQQEGAYGKHILFEANCNEGPEHTLANQDLILAALTTAKNKLGPVHINAPFSEPLYNTVQLPTEESRVNTFKEDAILDLPNERELEIWKDAQRILVLVGVLDPEQIDPNLIDSLLTDPRVLLMTETTSNLHHPQIITGIDQLIAALDQDQFKALQPELLLTFGGMIVSKKIKAFLRKHPPKHHWHIDLKKAYNTFFVLSRHFLSTPNTVIKELANNSIDATSNYRDYWLRIRDVRRIKHEQYLNEIPYCDFLAYSDLFRAIPSQSILQLSNSAAVRYAQLFELDSRLRVFCNRGTSGIDGSSSTAVGAAVAVANPTVLVTGDLSFFYDSNGLWNDYIPKSFRIIIINNQGGGIFRILPGDKEAPYFKTYFETRHQLKAAPLCEMFGFEYYNASDSTSLNALWEEFYQMGDGPKLLEIFTPADLNDKILLDYFDFVK